MRVDIVLDRQFFRLASADIGLRFVIRHDQLDRPAVDAARLVDAVDRHLRSDQRRLADYGGTARQRLQAADPVRLRRAEGGLPRRRHENRGAEADAARDDAAAGRPGFDGNAVALAHR